MLSARLSLALQGGAPILPASGQVLVLRPRGDVDLSALPQDRLHPVQGFRPDHDALLSRGFAVTTGVEGDHAAALVCLPRARAEGQALIATAAAAIPEGATIAVDGQKTDGIETMLRDLRARAPGVEGLSKAHGRILWFANPGAEAFADWQATPRLLEGGFHTLPGVFSADGIDPASARLAAALPARLPRRIADLGAGWGYLSWAALTRDGVEQIDLVEAEMSALDCARLNVTDPRARFHWADATRPALPGPVDAVVMNPPFHTGRATDPALGAAFIRAAATILTSSGTLWMVSNRHLPYESVLTDAFREVEEIAGDRSFRLTRAARPKAGPRAAR